MKIIAEKVKYEDLKPGDLFSRYDQTYWDNVLEPEKISAGSVWDAPVSIFLKACPAGISLTTDYVYKITIVKDDGIEWRKDAEKMRDRVKGRL